MSTNAAFAQKYGPWAVVTGASSGIGAQFVRSLASRGLHIILIARRVDKMEALAAEVRAKHNIQTQIIRADLSTPEGVTTVTRETAGYDIGLLINNAGIGLYGAYLSADRAAISRTIAVNAVAVAELAHSIGNVIAARGRGGIIFVSSILACPTPLMATYAATKAFVSTLAVSLQYETSGVDIMSFEPGLVESEIVDKMRSDGLKVDAMPTDVAVEGCLTQFGSSVVHTTSFSSRLERWCVDLLPYSWTMPRIFAMLGSTFEKAKKTA